jgi:hypothetical protein
MNEKRMISIPEKDYNQLHSHSGFTKFDDRILASSEFTPSEKIWLMFIRSKRTYFEDNHLIKPDGWFYCLQKYISEGTSISERTQTNIIKSLTDKGILEVSARGSNSATVNFYRINNLVYEVFAQKDKSDPQKMRVEQNQQVTETDNQERPAESAGDNPQKVRTKEIKVNKIKSILNAKAFSGGKPPQHKTILPRKANNPLNLVDTTIPPLTKPEGVKPRFSKLHKIRPAPITFDIQQIIDYWIAKGLHIHEKGTKSFDQAVIYITKAFNATLLEDFIDPKFHNYRFSVDSIKRSIDNFYLAAFDNKYEPLSLNTKQLLQRMAFKDFFWDKHRPDDENKSHLFKYLSKRKLASESILLVMKDTHPRCTKLVKDWYHQEFGGMVTEVSRQQQNAMILVGRKMEEFLVTHKAKLDMDYGMQIQCNRDPLTFLVNQLLRCESKILRENDGLRSIFQPSWLISENMLTDRFVYFLKSERTMK